MFFVKTTIGKNLPTVCRQQIFFIKLEGISILFYYLCIVKVFCDKTRLNIEIEGINIL